MKKALLLFAVVLAIAAYAADEAKCTVPVNTSSSVTTDLCLYGVLADAGTYTGDGGCWTGNGMPATSQSCTGMVVPIQCNVDVYVDPTASQGGAASSSDYMIEFSSNKDPAYIYLKPTQSKIAIKAVSADGGCNLGVSDRAKPR